MGGHSKRSCSSPEVAGPYDCDPNNLYIWQHSYLFDVVTLRIKFPRAMNVAIIPAAVCFMLHTPSHFYAAANRSWYNNQTLVLTFETTEPGYPGGTTDFTAAANPPTLRSGEEYKSWTGQIVHENPPV